MHPHSRETLATTGAGWGTTVDEIALADGVTDADALRAAIDDDVAAVLVQPNFLGAVEDLEALAPREGDRRAPDRPVDPMTLGVLRPPGDFGVDVAVGEGQPLGNRLDYGGPSFGFFAAQEAYLRRMPGRIAGETKTSTAAAASCSPCRRASSTSAARRRRRTSAPPRRSTR